MHNRVFLIEKAKKMALPTIVLLALILRVPGLSGSFWLDEAAQALESVRPLGQQLEIVADFQPPLLHLIVHFASQFSTSEWWLRAVGALIPGLITIIYSYKIAEKVFNQKTALISSLFLITSSFHIFYSQELRPYSLSAVWALVSWYYLLLNTDKQPNNWKNWLVYSLTTVLGLYSSYLYPFLLFGQLFFVIFRNKVSRHFLISLLVSAICFVFWLPMFLRQLEAGQLLRTSMPGWSEVVSTPQLKALALLIGKLYFGVIDLELNWQFILISLFLLVSVAHLILLNLKNKSLRGTALQSGLFILSWLIAPTISAWLVSFIVPVVQPKRLIFIQPALYMYLAYLITSVCQTKVKFGQLWKLAGFSLLTITLTINIISSFLLFTNPKYQRENWRQLQQEINRRFKPENTIIVNAFTEPFSPWAWYDKQNFPTFSTKTYYYQVNAQTVQELKQIYNYDYVLLFDYLTDLTDPDNRLQQEIEAFGYQGVGVIDYPHIGFVRIYVKRGESTS